MPKDLFKDWLDNLTTPQLRALASQAGIKIWMQASYSVLVEKLRNNADVAEIYEANFGS